MATVNRRRFVVTCASLILGGGWLAACGDTATPSATAAINNTPTQPPTASPPPTNTPSPSPQPPAATVTPFPTTVPTVAPTPANTPSPTVPANTPSPTAEIAKPTATTAPAMSLPVKVGQRMFAVFQGTVLTAEIRDFLLAIKPGGIVMFANNITSLDQIRRLNADLQTLAAQNGLPPFIITLDEEGGIVSRMPAEARDSIAPAQMAQAAAGLDAVRDCAQQTAVRLASLGFNLNLAPDADVNSNPQNPVIGTRSYGSDPTHVATAVQTALAAYQSQNMGTCVKHFPGHGDTDTDSHTGLPIINKTRADIDQLELVPFKAAIAAGTPAVMGGHILFPRIEPNGLPATLSPYFLTQVLRDELGFKGLILTDSLSMGAITQKYGMAEAGRLALKAGADMIIVNSDLDSQRTIYATLLAAAQRNDFAVDAPVARILAYKQTYATTPKPRVFDPAPIAAAAQHAITLLRNDHKALPIQTHKLLLVTMALANPTAVESPQPLTALGQLWNRTFPGQAVVEVSTDPTPAEITRTTRAAQQADTVIVVTRDASGSSAQASLVQTLANMKTALVVVAVRGPYDVLSFPDISNYIVTYSDVQASQVALITALQGKAPMPGRLPVTIPGLYGIGAGGAG